MTPYGSNVHAYVERYLSRTVRSAELFERAKKVMPGGNTRHTVFFQPHPLYLSSGNGAIVKDVDGNEYLDLSNNQGPLILGHNNPEVVSAVKEQLGQADGFAAPTELEIELAEMICEAAPCAESVRFTVTGSEATLQAMKIARAFAGKEIIAKFEGHYHGTHDYAQVSTAPRGEGSDSAIPWPIADSAGIPKGILHSMLILPWNDIHMCEKLVREHRDELAAIIVDPIANGCGIVPNRDFLAGLRELTQRYGLLLIFDEVITGFRLSLGGAQELYGVTPDLAAYGKIIGGGYPVGAVAGKNEVMSLYEANGDRATVKHGGTFNAHPVSMAAGRAALKVLMREGDRIYSQINRSGEELRDSVNKAMIENKIAGVATGVGSLSFLAHFGVRELRSYRDLLDEDRELNWLFGIGAISKGVYFVPGHTSMTCAALSRKQIETAASVLTDVLAGIRDTSITRPQAITRRS